MNSGAVDRTREKIGDIGNTENRKKIFEAPARQGKVK